MKSAANYKFWSYYIPERMAPGLERWIRYGVPPGDFLLAVLQNDLRRALERADEENIANLPAYVGYLYNEAPISCWGSRENVDNWRGTERQPEIVRTSTDGQEVKPSGGNGM